MFVPAKDEQGIVRFLDIPNEVIYLQSEDNGGIAFYTKNGKSTLILRLDDWASILNGADFIRVDRGAIVNLNQPWEFVSDLRVLKMQNDYNAIHIPVSEKRLAELIGKLK